MRSFLISALLMACRLTFAQPATAPATQPSQAELEKRFAEAMSNVVLNGQYTVGNSKPAGEKYTISSVEKLKDDNWLFKARVQFGEKDVTIPMIIPVKWAGDTPVLSVTHLWLPGLGTYTARVLIYDNQYAGTWSGGGHSGQLWGKIEKAPAGK